MQYLTEMGPVNFDNNKQLITLAVISLSGFNFNFLFIVFFHTHLGKQTGRMSLVKFRCIVSKTAVSW